MTTAIRCFGWALWAVLIVCFTAIEVIFHLKGVIREHTR